MLLEEEVSEAGSELQTFDRCFFVKDCQLCGEQRRCRQAGGPTRPTEVKGSLFLFFPGVFSASCGLLLGSSSRRAQDAQDEYARNVLSCWNLSEMMHGPVGEDLIDGRKRYTVCCGRRLRTAEIFASFSFQWSKRMKR